MKVRPISKIHTILCIDFDGTIVDHEFPFIGKLKKNAKQVINELYDEGFGIIIWTSRDSTFSVDIQNIEGAQPTVFDVHNFLESEGFKYDGININFPGLGFHPVPKVYADIYIDDRQLGGIPDDWKIIKALIYDDINSSSHSTNRTTHDAPGRS